MYRASKVRLDAYRIHSSQSGFSSLIFADGRDPSRSPPLQVLKSTYHSNKREQAIQHAKNETTEPYFKKEELQIVLAVLEVIQQSTKAISKMRYVDSTSRKIASFKGNFVWACIRLSATRTVALVWIYSIKWASLALTASFSRCKYQTGLVCFASARE